MKRIEKRTARRLYNKGFKIWAVPAKMNPYSVWVHPSKVEGDFDKWVKSFIFYNCTPETGRYPHYYVDWSKALEKELKK